MNEAAPYQHVAVFMGGFSAEREVSLRSGAAVADGLRAAGYTVSVVDLVSPEWSVPDGVEAVFIALHGAYGEDGTVQAALEAAGIPYTGSGSAASRLAFDKLASKEAFVRAGLPTPAYCRVRPDEPLNGPLPAVVKPVRQGSSVGIHVVRHAEDWADAVADAAKYDQELIVETFIPGRELTVGVVAGEALPVLEICAPQGNYDYRAKYTAGVTTYHVPAPVPGPVAEHCRRLALAAFDVLGCTDLGRVDFRMNSANELFILEVNTIPGFTATSLLPKAAQAAGLSFERLCDTVMRAARLKGSAVVNNEY